MTDFIEKDSSVAATFCFVILGLAVLPASKFRMYIFTRQRYRNFKASSADSNFLLSLSNVTANLYACSSVFRKLFQNPVPDDSSFNT